MPSRTSCDHPIKSLCSKGCYTSHRLAVDIRVNYSGAKQVSPRENSMISFGKQAGLALLEEYGIAPGDTILVAAGTYRETVKLKEKMTLKSAGDDAKTPAISLTGDGVCSEPIRSVKSAWPNVLLIL